jgi:thiamine-phosphate pyrophosphorylase
MTEGATGDETGPPPLLLVTDPAYGDDAILRVIEACGAALPARAFAVQLRDKRRELVSLRMFASRLRLLTKKIGAWLVINGSAQLARDVGADGVHLGGGSGTVDDARKICGERAFVSIAAHSDDAVRGGVKDGASGALVSAIFASPGKGSGRGVQALRAARAIAPPDFAIYALGGIDQTNAGMCIHAGATGVAVIRALFLAADPAAEARAIYDRMRQARIP